MASCTKCGATLVDQARFCAACGTPVVDASVVPPATRPRSIVHAAPDPYAKTVRREEEESPKPDASQPRAPPQPPQPQPFHAFGPGAPVLVYWADGNRYPGTVLQVSSQHVFVAFPNGTQQWIGVRYVTAGG